MPRIESDELVRRSAHPKGAGQPPVTGCLVKHAVLLPAPWTDVDRPRQNCRPSQLAAAFHKGQILHDGDFGEPAELLEGAAPNENPLVAVGKPPLFRPQRISVLQQPEQEPSPFDALPESAHHDGGLMYRFSHLGQGLGSQAAVGVQEHQDVALSASRASVLLSCAARRTGLDHRAVVRRDLNGGVVATAIDHHDFVGSCFPGAENCR